MLSETGVMPACTGPVRPVPGASKAGIERASRLASCGLARLMIVAVTLSWATVASAIEPPDDAAEGAEAPVIEGVDGAARPGAPAPEDKQPEADAESTPADAPPVDTAPVEAPPPSVEPPPPPAGPALGAPQASAQAAVEPVGPPSPVALTFALGGDLMHVDTDTEWGMTLRVGAQWSSATWRLHAAAGYAYNEREARAAAFDGYISGAWRALEWLDVGLYGSASVGSTGLFDPWYERTWAMGAELGECLDLSARAQLCFAQRIAPLGALTRRAVIVGGDVYRLPLETDRLIRAEATIGFRQEL